MASRFDSYSPVAGINGTMPDIGLQEGELRSADNFLFERAIAVTRPAAVAQAISQSSTIKLARSFDFGSSIVTALIEGNTLRRLAQDFTLSAPTGPALSMGTPDSISIDLVNGLVMAGGNAGGLVRHDPNTAVYTVVADAPYKYVTGHFSRAVAAHKIGSDSLLDPRTVAWSTAGQETDWTSYGAGSTVLMDASGIINALGNVRDVIVVGRTDGFHLGYATGSSTPAFDWKLHSKEAIGVKYPTTFYVYGTLCFFVGKDDVYTFNLVEPEPIGLQVRAELLEYLRNGYLYRGFVSQTYGLQSRPQYHLVPMGGISGLPHFCYDINDRIWSRHTYSFIPYGGWWMLLDANRSAPIVAEFGAQTLHLWTEGQACERDQVLRSRALFLGELQNDEQVTRGLLLYRSVDEEVANVVLRGSASVGAAVREESKEINLPGTARWRRRWFDFRLTGQVFYFDLTVLAGSRIEIKTLLFEHAEAGQLREG